MASSPLGRLGRTRAFVVLIVTAVVFVAIGIKLTLIQGLAPGRYLTAGASEWEQTVTLPADRGEILDRNGDELAVSVPQTTIYADPHLVGDPRAEAAALAPILHLSESGLQTKLASHTGFQYLARTVDDATAAKVAKLHLVGIYSLMEPKRFYPAGQLASPILGTVGVDNTGLAGLEYKYNSLLGGQAGQSIEEIDPQGRQIPGGLREYKAPVAGQDLVLSIDEPLQYQAEQALAQAIVAAKANDGIALLMDTKTGEILADAELATPTKGNTKPPAVPDSVSSSSSSAPSTNQPVEASSATSFTDVYEPGSVNKLITVSAALQSGVVVPSDHFTIPDTYDVAGTTFHDAESHATEYWSVTDILANSSNIGTIQISQRLGKTDLLKYIHDFGLGSQTDVGFPGESAGLLPSYWSGTSIADVPIGQGIAVTAVQLLAAYNTIANGGVYVAPRLVDATIDDQGHEHPVATPAPHRVVSTAVAKQMTTMLDEVVRVGTGTAANLDPYTVAGKTGTALVPSATGGYEPGHYVASFAGFVPAEDPQITAMVVIDDTPDYGASASAPTFATIARDALHELDIPPHAKEPPAPGVPLATPQSATGAGEVAGAPLPGLATPPHVASGGTSTTSPTTALPAYLGLLGSAANAPTPSTTAATDGSTTTTSSTEPPTTVPTGSTVPTGTGRSRASPG